MTFFEKNEENLETLVYSLKQREKTTIVIGIYDCDDTCDKAIAYVTKQFREQRTFFFDLYGQKINSLLAFFRENLPKKETSDFPIVHITRIDPLLFISENHKVVSSALVTQINMERELLFHEVEALVVLWVTREGYNRLRMDAPDFMDWVVASFTFENEEAINTQQLSFVLPKETIEDRSKAILLELKDRAEKLQLRTLKFENATKLSVKDKKEYFNLLLSLIDAYKELHDLTNAQNTLQKAYTLAKDSNLATGFEFGNLLLDWGGTETDLGNLAASMTLFEEALQLFLLLEDNHNISVCLRRIGDTHRSLGNLEKALTFFGADLKLTKELYTTFPNNVDVKNGLAISCEKLGDTYSSLGNLESALTFYEERNKLGQELYIAYPNNVSFKNGLAVSYEKLGDMHSSLGNLEKALTFYEERNKLGQELYTANPNKVDFKNGLAISYAKLGDTQSSLGNLENALTFYEDFTRLMKELYTSYPNNVSFKNGLAISYSKLGDTQSSLGNLESALTFYEERNKIGQELYIANPNNVSFKNGLATSYSKLGSTHSSLGNLEKALTFYEADLKLTKELYIANPNNVSFKNGLAISYSKLGSTHSSLGNLENALTFYEDYNRLEQELYVAHPNNISFKNGLAISYAKLGVFSRDNLKNKTKALAYFQQAENLWLELVSTAPQYVQFQKFLRMIQNDIKDLE